jgi:arsenite methyltransferase
VDPRAASSPSSPASWAGPAASSAVAWRALLDERNGPEVRAAVATLQVREGETAADLGFGGGLGLRLLLDRVGPTGRVHGLDRSATAVRRAWRQHREDVRAGRLRLEPPSTRSPSPIARWTQR